jgi:hypothetical protein
MYFMIRAVDKATYGEILLETHCHVKVKHTSKAGMSLEEPCEISGDPSRRSAVGAASLPPILPGAARRSGIPAAIPFSRPGHALERAGDFTRRAKGISPAPGSGLHQGISMLRNEL